MIQCNQDNTMLLKRLKSLECSLHYDKRNWVAIVAMLLAPAGP